MDIIIRNILKRCLVVALVLLSSIHTQAIAESYAVIGNVKNKLTDKEVAQQIKRIYLKQQKRWSNGILATVFDRGEDTSEDRVFRNTVLKMETNELSDHWLGIKQKTGETPPRTITSTRTLLKLISRYEGSFGIISQKETDTLPDGLRVLLTINN